MEFFALLSLIINISIGTIKSMPHVSDSEMHDSNAASLQLDPCVTILFLI